MSKIKEIKVCIIGLCSHVQINIHYRRIFLADEFRENLRPSNTRTLTENLEGVRSFFSIKENVWVLVGEANGSTDEISDEYM